VQAVSPAPVDARRSIDLALSQIPGVLEAVEVHVQSRCPANRDAARRYCGGASPATNN
jgi:hypothetical protein